MQSLRNCIWSCKVQIYLHHMGAKVEKTLALLEDNWTSLGLGITNKWFLEGVELFRGHTGEGGPKDTLVQTTQGLKGQS